MARFNHLNVPGQWQQYWTQYPEGYTIMEALINWTGQIDTMTDNVNNWNDYLDKFVLSFDKDLQGTVRSTVDIWKTDGTLDQLVNGTLFPELYPYTIQEEEKYTLKTEHYYDPGKPLEYWVTTITPKDSEALKTLLKKDYAASKDEHYDTFAKEAVHKNAHRNKARFAINASGWIPSQDSRMVGVQVKDGVVHKNTDPSLQDWYTLGVTKEGILEVFPATVTGEQLVNEHDIVNTWSFSIPLVQNGVKVSDSVFQLYSPSYYTPYARQVIGQVEGTNDIIILTVDKNDTRSIGMTLTECADIMLTRGCRVAYNLDGGGSTQTVSNGKYLNRPGDGIPRETCDILYVEKFNRFDEYSDFQKDVFNAIGAFPNLSEAFNQLQKTALTMDNGAVTYTNRGNFDFDDLYGTKFLRHYTDVDQADLVKSHPFEGQSADMYILNMQSDSHSRAQLVFNRSNSQLAFRFNNLGSWTTWKYIDGNPYASFTDISLENGWQNVGGSDPKLQYAYKNGMVEIRGVIKAGTGNAVAGVLPSGFRPKSRIQVGTVRNDGAGDTIGRLFITTGGAIIPLQPAANYIYIQCTFMAEQ
jgi:hypothetical protein